MSVEPSSTPGRPEEQDSGDLASGADHAANAVGLRHQAVRIIESVLADTAPEHHLARKLLRQQVAAHPGNPERALMEQLTALKALDGPLEGASRPSDPVQPDAAPGE